MPSQKLWFAFGDNLMGVFSVVCKEEDRYWDLKEKIQNSQKLPSPDIIEWILYRPGTALSRDRAFTPNEGYFRLSPRSFIQFTDPKSGNPGIVIVIYIRHQPRGFGEYNGKKYFT